MGGAQTGPLRGVPLYSMFFSHIFFITENKKHIAGSQD